MLTRLTRRAASAAALAPKGVTIVDTPAAADAVVEKLLAMSPSCIHAVDTEVADIDVSKQSPVGNGTVICLSVYSGPEVDFGNGPRLWVDNMDAAEGTLSRFAPFLESTAVKKAYHNYSFDRHALFNHGINARGLGADTMHMARLWSASRAKRGGYSLESLTADILHHRKVPMKERFALHKLKKDGSPGKETYLPPVDDIQTSEEFREAWIDYSTYDTEGTWKLEAALRQRLRGQAWAGGKTMYDWYTAYMVPYAEVLTDMEREGIRVDVEDHLPAAQVAAERDLEVSKAAFREWAVQYSPDAEHMNIGSGAQKAHLLFAPCTRRNTKKGTPQVVLGTPGTYAADATEWPAERSFPVDNEDGFVEEGATKPKKTRDIVLTGLGMAPVSYTASGWPAADAAVLRALAGDPAADPPVYGAAFQHFGGGQHGVEACQAVADLLNVSTVETLLSHFILPLQTMADDAGRVHCSLNINTETGRLSARRPNLQNQPALEKDRFKIRKAFMAAPGNSFVVADYGQLELRLLAHMTGCRSMIDAFAAGGDFHSRTAVSMYPDIASAVDSGAVRLEEADGSQDGVPLVKSVYASERRKAKVLNFSIAYGKTPMGLSKDWGVSLAEARDTLDKWYAARPEVATWQQHVKERARRDGATRTLMGRYRELPHINSRGAAARNRAERAAINTPIQGGAADVVMMAMLKVARNEVLQRLGWRMLLQIHDELILEGPSESAEEAMAEVVADMEHPFAEPLLVDLAVDANIADNWYDAK